MQEQLTNDLITFEADHIWVHKNMGILLEKYSDQWIAVKNGRVIACDPELTGLLAKIPDPAHTCIEFITHEPLEMVL